MIAVVAVLRAGATEKVVGFCCEFQLTVLRSFVHGRYYTQGSSDTRYLVQLVSQALSEHVGAGRAFSHN